MESPWLHRYAILLAVCTLFLVVGGASVTSKDAGLSVPDWPLSYGQVIPQMTGGVFVLRQFPEHGSLRPAATATLSVTFPQIFLGLAAYALTLAASIVLAIQIRRNVRPHEVMAAVTA